MVNAEELGINVARLLIDRGADKILIAAREEAAKGVSKS